MYEPVVLLLRENLVYLARPAKQKIKLLIFRPTFSEIAISMSIEIVTTISLLPHFSLIRSRL